MRTALLTSFLAYASGLMLLGVDVGRPWNFYWVFTPWRWNLHSPLLEVAVCMPTYAMFPLLLENVPPVLDWLYYKHRRSSGRYVEKAEKIMYPVLSAGSSVSRTCLPAMHQSSLGALMLLGGEPRLSACGRRRCCRCSMCGPQRSWALPAWLERLLFCSLVWDRPFDRRCSRRDEPNHRWT